jgi:DNA (cytosine-5)-methyltransferase 1
MTHGSLFSGIGGFDLASEWIGWKNLFHCELNPFAQKVLKHYWPNAELFIDIKKSNFTKYANKIDVLTGGFPCQPYSSAGKRLGKEDDRHLWPEMLRAIREIQPRYVVGENVRGLTNWNGGLVFDEVQADLEAEGYEVLPFLLPACAVNAPHRRDRIWFIAYSNLYGFNQCNSNNEINASKRGVDAFSNINKSNINGNVTNTFNRIGKMGRENDRMGRLKKLYTENRWYGFPTVDPVCNGNDGISERLDGITFSKWRIESIKAGGNAIVPQVALQIFKAINQLEKLNNEF